jgi:hypothetical protein
MSECFLDRVCDLIQEDIGCRGLRADPNANLVSATVGDYHAACRSIAVHPKPAVAVVTGFFIPHGQPPSGETDGPLGALFLARALTPLGIDVALLTDGFCMPALEVGLAACRLEKAVPALELPQASESREWFNDFTRQFGLTHLVALERAGPSHTPESVQAQVGAGPDASKQFLSEVTPEHFDRCQTMRGRDITANMAPAHLLFESTGRQSPAPITIGIGDGGNEIGMGKIPWKIIRRNIPGGSQVACRVPADHLIVVGISNWGAYGLAAGIRLLRKAPPSPELYNVERERDLLQLMVGKGPLVDGVTGLPTVSVDGLSFDRYAHTLKKLESMEAEKYHHDQ